MAKTKIISLMMVIAIQAQLWDDFSALTWLPIQLGFPLPFHIQAKSNFCKKKVYFDSTKLWTHN